MNDRSVTSGIALSIAAVERDTGLAKDTLRVWERRYGFPSPGRDSFGERSYPIEQVDKLRVIRRLMDIGHRPGRIISLSLEDLHALAAQSAEAPRTASDLRSDRDDLQRFIELTKAHDVDGLRRSLSQAAVRMGVDRFVVEVAAPLNRMVGEAWARGYFEVFEEHLYTESMQIVLRNAISTIPHTGNRPRVLLTTFPNESHGLGLLMVESILTLEGCGCLSLGVQTPVWDIVLAATAHNADIVALSFTASLGSNAVADGLAELRAKLPRATELWAGGQSPALARRSPPGIQVFRELTEITPAVARWRGKRV
ncbi:MAG: MerR family transcriptional regulator [Betaproteobacteria bacterium]|nr:MerR family transcriptional regulator [Betaproteobacteria bacterium]